MSTETIPSTHNHSKPIEYGSGIIVKNLDDKILICAENKTKIREGNFLLVGDNIVVEAGKGIKISSRHPNVLVISCDTSKQDEIIFDLKKEINSRLETIEKVFAKIIKSVKT